MCGPMSERQSAESNSCIVCGTSPARYGQVCGAACDMVMGTPEDFTLLWVALFVLVVLVGMTLWAMLS